MSTLPSSIDHLPLDHLVVAARTLSEGAAWARERLGVEPGPVGVHPHFGTHNHLWSLGTCYLEVIATDPQVSVPPYPRWFGLSDPATLARLESGPQLLHWVAQSKAAHKAAPLPAQGEYLPLERGDYRWSLTVPLSGSLPAGGLLPSLIQWHTPSPLSSLPQCGLEFRHLTLETPNPAALTAQLAGMGLMPQPWLSVQVGSLLRLSARIATPAGVVEL